MGLLERLAGSVGTLSDHVEVTAGGVKAGHRLAPLDDVDRFDVEEVDSRPGNADGDVLPYSTADVGPSERRHRRDVGDPFPRRWCVMSAR